MFRRKLKLFTARVMFDELRNKKILIISPQPFSGLFVSKQHYAIELAKKNNHVYFLEPPLADGKSSEVILERLSSFPSITLVKYKAFFNLNFRFHVPVLFNRLMHAQVKRILKAISDSIDIVWCFETNLFINLAWFKAKMNIYHVVDPVKSKQQIAAGKSADIIFCVSEKILQSFSRINVPKFFINHGVTGAYLKAAQDLLPNIRHFTTGKAIQVGYIGNLLRGPVNYQVLRKIVLEHSQISFHFWGTSSIKPETGRKAADFINFLTNQPNAHLHGIKTPEELVMALSHMDAFLLAYVFIEGESDRSNSHKILEYLSTGKVIISSFVETYKADEPLICMSSDTDDDQLPVLFGNVIKHLDHYNSGSLQKKRIELALENSYENQINKIETLLKSL
jgi:glycosyltransferase involved in cell wall biosynthesis